MCQQSFDTSSTNKVEATQENNSPPLLHLTRRITALSTSCNCILADGISSSASVCAEPFALGSSVQEEETPESIGTWRTCSPPHTPREGPIPPSRGHPRSACTTTACPSSNRPTNPRSNARFWAHSSRRAAALRRAAGWRSSFWTTLTAPPPPPPPLPLHRRRRRQSSAPQHPRPRRRILRTPPPPCSRVQQRAVRPPSVAIRSSC